MSFFFYVLLISFFTSGCTTLHDKPSLHDKKENVDIKDIVKPVKTESPPIKSERFKKKEDKKKVIPKSLLKPVSISISEETPLKQIFIALSEQADVDLQLDPKIDNHIVFTATKRPFYEVIKDICEMTHLRLIQNGKSIRIEQDLPYSKNYNLQFLNLERNSNNRISIATDVFNSMNIGAQSVQDNSSNSEVNVQGHNTFWKEVEDNIKIILSDNSDAHYAIHKQGGILSIRATQKQHDLIDEYIRKLKKVSGHQVLIEAKIIEVELKDDFKSGINWHTLEDSYGFKLSANLSDIGDASSNKFTNFAKRKSLELGGAGNRFSGILKALEDFGTSKTLSSPRLTVMNNQIAVLKVAQNKVYFKLHYDKQVSTANNFQNLSLSSDIQTIPIGLVMSVQPSIDEETGDIILCLRPTISKLSSSEADPAVDIAYANAPNQKTEYKPSSIPVVDVKEIDSVLRVKSGEVAILGGLMEVQSINDSSGLPGIKDIPFVKDLLSAKSTGERVVELVIVLQATIVENPKMHQADERLIEDHISDSRPLINS